MNSEKAATVIGAGVVGMATALTLQREGWRVTVIDRVPPGESCSFGNAGGIGVDHAFPVATPGMWKKIPRYLLDPLGPLALRPAHFPRLLPWLLRFLPTGSGARFGRTIDALGALQHVSYDCWQPLLKDARLEDEVRHSGCINPYESEANLNADLPVWRMLQARGYKSQVLGADELRQLEPGLPHRYACAIFEPEFRRVLDPFRIVVGLAEAFQRHGGTVLREIVSAFEMGPNGPTAIRTNRGLHPVRNLVIAAGAVSNRLAAQLGSAGVPVEAGRGYHVTLPNPGFELRHVLVAPEHQVAITPMSMGLRFAGTLEFAGADSAPDWRRADAVLKIAQRVFPGIRTEGYTQWSGDRPMMPDSVPVISRSPVFRNVFYGFGSGHYGLTQAAVVGRLIAEMMGGRETFLDVEPYRIDRF
jgi:glycine/D-amino acid oxidase-like deaminating enzyme